MQNIIYKKHVKGTPDTRQWTIKRRGGTGKTHGKTQKYDNRIQKLLPAHAFSSVAVVRRLLEDIRCAQRQAAFPQLPGNRHLPLSQWLY